MFTQLPLIIAWPSGWKCAGEYIRCIFASGSSEKSTSNRFVSMSNPEIPDSPQVKFIHEWAQAIDNKNLDLVAKSMHKDYRHILYPRSLGKPDQTKQEWLERLTEVVGLWTENKVNYIGCYWILSTMTKPLSQLTVHSVIDAPGKVIVHVRILDIQINTTST